MLTRISVQVLKTTYAYGEAINPADDILVIGTYQDGSEKIETITPDDLSGYDPNKVGLQTVRVVKGEKVATFEVTIEQSPSAVNITVGLPSNGQDVPFNFSDGTADVVPTNQIIELSAHGIGKPKNLVINAAGFTSVDWYIDNVHQSTFTVGSNILNLTASAYTYGNEHTITFIGTRDGRQFSRTIWFTVEF
ncbi:hypothetical protein FACS1894109_07370 [Spirochaetia bacterium]|nr:hypothetical protein FACS1894109_07370 [Spirochaetia bacterium]